MFYPPKNEQARLQDYAIYNSILNGKHYEAFRGQLPEFLSRYEPIKYLAVNFGGLISKLSADMLFEEFPKITFPDGKNEWLELVFRDNNLKTQFYESALEGSARGDALFRIRAKDGKLVIEDINPAIWFPLYNENNTRAEPTEHRLAWEVSLGNTEKAVYMERHLKGQIITELWKLVNGELAVKLDIKKYYPNVIEVVYTGINEFLIIHIPNPKTNSSFYGSSDYQDLLPLMYAINNRLTRVDSILDKHGDPILAVPKGVLDENGQVRRGSFGVVEVDTGETGGEMPQYIVWDAKLESALAEIDALVEFVLMLSESNRTALGIEKEGGAGVESGKALKYKLLRTLAKKHRKELYFDAGIKKLLYIAQLFAKANGLVTMDNMKLKAEPQQVGIEWQDGVIVDLIEQLEIEERRLNAGLTTKVDSIARLDGISVADAEKKVVEIEKEEKENAPKFNALPFVKTDSNKIVEE